MPAYWLTYKPYGPTAPRGWPSERLTALVDRFDSNPLGTTEWWRMANQKARVGERVYLFKQGDGPRGIFGVGSIISGPDLREKADDGEGVRPRAEIQFDALVDPSKGFLLSLEEITDIIPVAKINTQASGTVLPDAISGELEARLGPLLLSLPSPIASELSDDGDFDPDSVSDVRERALRSIRMRRGQGAFRSALFEAYDRRCVVTGCSIKDVLDAAHIYPYKGSYTNHVSNGLLLRTDLHTLFDCDLIGIDPSTRCLVVAESLKGSSYAKLSGRPLRQPHGSACGPSKKNLQRRYTIFEGLEKQRERA